MFVMRNSSGGTSVRSEKDSCAQPMRKVQNDKNTHFDPFSVVLETSLDETIHCLVSSQTS
jgi:hypothetical protein